MRLAAISIAAALLAAPAAVAAPPPARPGAPISSHAMVHTCCTPPAMMERIFTESKAMGARFIRVDVELSGIFEAGHSIEDPNWARLDAVLELSRQHQLPILGIILSPPSWAPFSDAAAFGRLAGEVAAHARGTVAHWEILNEPDSAIAFDGTPEQYAHMLRAAYDAIGARVPEAHVAMGGVATPEDRAWIERVLATPGAGAAHAFDIANVHLRGHERSLPGRLVAWRELLRRHGFAGPVWVTEHGYPADPAYQGDRAFRGGEAAQAAFLTESVLSLAEAGADEVFVTLRDNLDGGFASEGVVRIDEHAPFAARRKPAFAAVRRLVDRWDALLAARAEQRLAEESARREEANSAEWRARAIFYRAVMRQARAKLARLRLRHWSARRERVRIRLRREIERSELRVRRLRGHTGWAKAAADDFARRVGLYEARAAERAAFVAGG